MGYVWIIFVTYMFGVLMAPCYLIFGCENQKVVGLEGDFGLPYNSSASCECPSDATPLVSCGEDGLQYLSPCYAGCSVEDGKLFRNCSQLLAPHTGGMVTPGVCDAGCDQNFLIYVVLHGAQNLIENLSNIPRSLLILRYILEFIFFKFLFRFSNVMY
ncbi:solute carrier organic anion transporter family member 1A2-like [Aplysia californica]|uniref:Solute carrier organic anion transporter family member 1A2-like n=1 Tax=Aplysia californica TaxID=6500 RepID=A0ABM1A2E6_APLCA|nr:solute carrier organic anion transporter family member 1A2-like [Aplysia californica]